MERNASVTLSLLSLGSERKVKCYNGYFVNGYVFLSKWSLFIIASIIKSFYPNVIGMTPLTEELE
jgi:hypothetical protein